ILLNLITISNLPFLFVEHQKFCDLFSFVRLAPELPSFPLRKVIRERLRGFIRNRNIARSSLGLSHFLELILAFEALRFSLIEVLNAKKLFNHLERSIYQLRRKREKTIQKNIVRASSLFSRNTAYLNQRSRGFLRTIPYSDQLVYIRISLPSTSRVRNHEREFPILISITRDIMSILATSAGVKRLFNSARDICYYRWGSLSLETIRDIILYIYTIRRSSDRFSKKQEIVASSEELYIRIYCAEAISNTKEDIEMHLHTPAIVPLLAVAARKRPAINSNDEDDSDTDDITDLEETLALLLPNTQQRVLGRMRKRSRLLDGYIV
ncbi:hypothetical protein N7516_000656, partial [Penicillium verrucosum]|uniref:uncharacterized protein n=1 Tax=Penicillium verrucosum TaxID=60171 RepID=UPI0025455E64